MAFGKEAEERLLNCVREVQGHVTGGDHPTEAITKVARQEKLSNDMIQLLVQAYNNGRQSYQREKCSGQGVLCKVAEFPLASVEEVRSIIFPSKPVSSAVLKSASVSAEYSRAPVPPRHYERPPVPLSTITKTASVAVELPTGIPETRMKRADGLIKRLKRATEEGHRHASAMADDCLLALGIVSDYFKQAEYMRLPLAEVEYNSVRLYGEPARHVFNYITQRNRTKEARSGDRPPRLAQPVNERMAPYSLVKAAIAAGERLLAAKRTADALEKEAQAVFDTELRPFLEGEPARPPTSILAHVKQASSPTSQEKVSFFGSLLAGAGGAGAFNMMRTAAKPTDKLLEDTVDDLEEPDHVDELRGIEAKAMLNDLLANDEVISGYNPDEVAEAFNEIGKLNPSATNQPAIMRPLLRQRLSQGTLAPFEAQQVADIEKTMRQTDKLVPDSSMGSAINRGSKALR